MMRSIWRNWASQSSVGKKTLPCLLVAQAFACGGAMDDGGSASGAAAQQNSTPTVGQGGNQATVTPSSSASTGSTGASTGSAASPICFGQQVAAPTACMMTVNLPAFSAKTPECLVTAPIAANMKLNPSWAHIYFKRGDGIRTEVPYVGVGAAACANATTYGGWYATNTTGGKTDMGLCECACNAARKYAFHLDIDCAGFPKM